MFTRYLYTRPQKENNYFADPELEYDTVHVEQTPFWSDKSYLAKVHGEDPTMTEILNSHSEFNWQNKTDNQALSRCNNNIEHKEWEEFTMVDREIIDNRVLSDWSY